MISILVICINIILNVSKPDKYIYFNPQICYKIWLRLTRLLEILWVLSWVLLQWETSLNLMHNETIHFTITCYLYQGTNSPFWLANKVVLALQLYAWYKRVLFLLLDHFDLYLLTANMEQLSKDFSNLTITYDCPHGCGEIFTELSLLEIHAKEDCFVLHFLKAIKGETSYKDATSVNEEHLLLEVLKQYTR